MVTELQSSECNVLSVGAKSVPGEFSDRTKLIADHNCVYTHQDLQLDRGACKRSNQDGGRGFWGSELFPQNAFLKFLG